MLGNREPRKSAGVRDAILHALRDGVISAPHDDDRTPGVVLVGGGPGDPELVTVAARRALSEADVVVADRLAPRELLDELSPDVELVDVAKLPAGPLRRRRRRSTGSSSTGRWPASGWCASRAATRSSSAAATRRRWPAPRPGVPWTVVPGLTSAISVPAAAGIPVTHRGVAHEFTVISGHLPPGHPDSLVEWDARWPGCAARWCC